MKTTERPNNEANAPTDWRWLALQSRDSAAIGRFVYSVRSTGVYCLPSCPSRLPRRDNVQFHPTTEDAERAGFRPCKRCKPDQARGTSTHAEIIAACCQLIAQAESAPSLQTLADHAGLSAHHFHRVFKQITGVTPKAYADAQRRQRVHRELQTGASVTEAMINAGYQSSGRFYEQTDQMLGMTPSAYRRGGADMRIRFAVGQCSLGAILVAQSERGICAIALGDDANALVQDLQRRFDRASLIGGDAAFEQTVATVIGFIEAPKLGLSLPLDIRGTAFQQRVWQALREIPPGQTVSYTDIAQRIGAAKAVRAVAGACAANAIAVAIPCHRVVRRDGDLSGYRWGVERKRRLLDKESQS